MGETHGYTIRTKLKPGDLGYITYLHGVVYAEEHGFDTTFESYVAKPLSEFVLSRGNPRQRIWVVEHEGRVVGSVAIVEADQHTAQLRWLILLKDARGLGLGKKLVEDAIRFSVEAGYSRVFLWTVSELKAAAHVYASHGFVKTESTTHRIWGKVLTEEKYELQLT